jgi:hypothetical protein
MRRRAQPSGAAPRRRVGLAWLLTGALAGCLNPRPEELPSYDPDDSPGGPVTGSAGGAGTGGLQENETPSDSNGSAGTGGSGAGSGGQPSAPPVADAGVDAGAAADAGAPSGVEPADAAGSAPVEPGPTDAAVSPDSDAGDP